MFLIKTDRICITKTHRKSKTLIFIKKKKKGRNLQITAKLTCMTQVSGEKADGIKTRM